MKSVKKSYFNPLRYGNKESESLSEERIVTKGGQEVLRIDLNRLETDLDHLHKKSDVMIKDLDQVSHGKYRRFVSYVQLLYDSEHYDTLFELIRSKFSNLEKIVPGTVGAYFGGCLVDIKVDRVNPTCVPSVVASVPPSRQFAEQQGKQTCSQTVFWGFYDKGKFTVVQLKYEEGSNKAILFVNQSSVDEFPGLSDTEKADLAKNGVQKVKIIGYSSNGKDYYNIYDDFIPLSEVKSRVGNLTANSTSLTPNNITNNFPAVILFIIFLLVLIFILWKMSQSQGQGALVY